jgi:hypothetical protein
MNYNDLNMVEAYRGLFFGGGSNPPWHKFENSFVRFYDFVSITYASWCLKILRTDGFMKILT